MGPVVLVACQDEPFRGFGRCAVTLADAFYKARLDGAARHHAVNEHLHPGML